MSEELQRVTNVAAYEADHVKEKYTVTNHYEKEIRNMDDFEAMSNLKSDYENEMKMIEVLEKKNINMKLQFSTPFKDPETSIVPFLANDNDKIKQRNILSSEGVNLTNTNSGKNDQNVDANIVLRKEEECDLIIKMMKSMEDHIQQINIDITINATSENINMHKLKLGVNNESHSAALKKIESLRK